MELDVPRDRDVSFAPRLVAKVARRTRGLDDMVIRLHAGEVTGLDLARDRDARTIFKITALTPASTALVAVASPEVGQTTIPLAK